MINPRVRAVLAASVCTLVALTSAACSSSSSGGALSADEFRSKADGICKAFNEQNANEPEPSSPSEVLGYLEKMIPKAQDQLRQLKELTPPEDMKATYEEALKLQGQSLDLIVKAKDRVKGGEDPMTVITSATGEINTLNDQGDEKARILGLVECGKDESSTSTTATTSTTASVPTTFDTTPVAPVDPTETSPTETSPADTTSDNPTGTVSAMVFSQDASAFGQKLMSFGQELQAVSSSGLDGVKAKASQLRGQLDDMDTIVGRMRGYTVDNPELEKRRAAIVAASPDVTRLGRDFLDAAESGDTSRLASVAGEFTSALSRLSKAATG